MKFLKPSFLWLVIFFIGGFNLSAQSALSNGKALNFPTKKYGISIGNSHEFTGIRINFADENVKRINGLNVTFWLKQFKNQNAVVNGISFGVIPTCGTMRPINLGVLGIGTAHNISGLTLGGLAIGAGGDIKGLSISGFLTMADGANSVITGIAVAGIGLGAQHAINGLALGGLAIGTEDAINGIASSLAFISAEKKFQGIAFTGGYLESKTFKGAAIAGYAHIDQMYGLSIAFYNRTKELHGVQLGLMNYAENNRKGLKMLPIINLHLR